MAEDQVKQDAQNQDVGSGLESLGTAALALGAGAAVFYRAGGVYLVADQLNRLSRASQIALRDFNKTGTLQRSPEKWKKFLIHDIWDAWKQSDRYTPKDFRFNPEETHVFTLLQDTLSIEGNTRFTTEARSLYHEDMLGEFYRSDRFRNLPTRYQHQLRDFLEKVYQNADSPAKLQELRRNLTGVLLQNRNEVESFMDALLNRMKANPLDLDQEQSKGWFNSNYDRVRKLHNKKVAAANDPRQFLNVLQRNQKQNKIIDKALGDRGVTLRDLLYGEFKDQRDLFDENIVYSHGQRRSALSVMEEKLLQWQAQYKDNDKMMSIVDQILDSELSADFRVRNGRLVSLRTLHDIKNTGLNEFSNTLLGRILKTRDSVSLSRVPTHLEFKTGEFQPVLAKALGMTGAGRLERDVVVIGNNIYGVTKNNELEFLQKSDDFVYVPTDIGSQGRLNQSRWDLEETRQPNREGSGFGHHILDLDQPIQVGLKDTSEEARRLGNNLTYFQNPELTTFKQAITRTWTNEELADQMSRLARMHRFIDEHTLAMDSGVFREFRHLSMTPDVQQALSIDMNGTRNFLNIMDITDVQKLVDTLPKPPSGAMQPIYKNENLTKLLKAYRHNPQAFMNDTLKRFADPAGGGHIAERALGIFRREMQREMFYRMFDAYNATDPNTVYKRARELVEKLADSPNVSSPELLRARRFLMSSYLDWRTSLRADIDKQQLEEGQDIVQQVYSLIGSKPKEEDVDAQLFQKDFASFVKQENSDATEFADLDPRKNPRIQQSKWTVMRRSDVLGVLRDTNLSIKERAMRASKMLFGGGPGQEEYTTVLGNYIYNMLDRLNNGMNSTELGELLGTDFSLPTGPVKAKADFSLHHGRGNTVELAKNLFLKRALPVMVGFTALDFVNDAQKQLTGMSTETSLRSGAANLNLGLRKVMDFTGLTGAMKTFVESNVIAQYLTDSKTWNSEAEERDYYQNGYTPMRRGRFWAFGSAAEFRGGEIEYWRPNALRESTADAYTASVYGGLRNKWSHSLLPTPFNPLSPLAYIMDPYYLERWHYYDRPYPLTGPMFQENTPWGAVLNATVGELIKPVKRMHEDELEGGISAKMLLAQINAYTKQRALSKRDGDLIVLQNGRIQPTAFMAYNAPTPSTRILSIHRDNEYGETRVYAQQPGVYYGGIPAADYTDHVRYDNATDFTAVNEPNEPLSLASDVPGNTQRIRQQPAPELTAEERIAINAGKQGNTFTNVANNVIAELRHRNQQTKDKAASKPIDSNAIYLDRAQGVFIPDKIRYAQSDFQQQIDQESQIEDALHSQQGMGFVHSMATSMRLMSGIYGWMAGGIGEFGEVNRPHIQNASDMTSFSRTFWDNAYGGLGGDVMEIARRFIPTYARYTAINPLMNTMPDWLPQRYRHGDAFSSVPNGEERLPGKGYEALHQLHPDLYGRYGALDRYAILSDIAPFSEEAKFWKNIAAKTAAQTEEGKAEFKAIRDRAKAAQQPQYYDYKFLGRGLDTKTVTVSEILGRGKFKVFGSDETYTLAGVKVLDTNKAGTDQVMMQYLQPGQEVTIRVDSNPAYRHVKDNTNSISAAVIAGGQNVSEAMVEAGDAEYKQSDTSAAASIGRYGDLTYLMGAAAEAIGHLNIPWIHSQFLRIETPLESYQNNHVYGTPYQTWSDVWGTTIRPGFEASVGYPGMFFLSQITRTTFELMQHYKPDSKWTQWASHAYTFTDRGAFIGSTAGRIAKLGGVGQATLQRQLRRAGSTVSSIMALGVSWQYSNPLYAALAFGRVGFEAASVANKFIPVPGKVKALVTAASVAGGLLLWGGTSQGGLRNQRGVWVPERTQEKWLMNDYFDRLTYIKMMGLYHKAAAEAKSKEGVDVEKLFRVEMRDRMKKSALKAELERDKQEIMEHPTNASADALTIINKKLQALSSTKTVLRGGEYTKSAILYRQAAEATMYALKPDATMTEILRALPQEDRDYFMQFIQERDEDRRKEILRYASPQLRKALKQMWGIGTSRTVSNEQFFRKFKLPGSSWKGWRPDVNLSDVKAKVIKNEGMLFGDFGIYESAYRKPSVINAPNIENPFIGSSSALMVKAKLSANLRGLGLTGVDVSVEPKPSGGVQMAAAITRALPDSLQNQIENAFSA